MKKKLLLFGMILTLIMMFAMPVSAETYGDLTYEITNGEVTITGYDESLAGNVSIPSSIKGCPVTGIGDFAFYECWDLRSIEIPNGVMRIGDAAFASCASLNYIEIPSTVTVIGGGAFEYSGLHKVVFHEGLICIGCAAFSSTGISDVTIPASVKIIESSAFDDAALKSITILNKIAIIEEYAFDNDYIQTIYGYRGSTAETYAKENGIPFSLLPTPTPTPDPAPEPIPAVNFTDVEKGEYYYDAVAWAVYKNITTGTSVTTFSPENACTRGQAVTFLWRAAGKPAPKSSYNPFTDVKAGQYYYDAVLWAVENGVTKGTSATTFSPDATCNRGQIVTFLYRAEGEPNVAVRSTFGDVKTDAYYAKAVTWAVNEKVTSGTSATTFSPDNDCTRGQIVTFLYRSNK